MAEAFHFEKKIWQLISSSAPTHPFHSPLAADSTFDAALWRLAATAGIEAAHTLRLQAVAEVSVAVEEAALRVVHRDACLPFLAPQENALFPQSLAKTFRVVSHHGPRVLELQALENAADFLWRQLWD